MIIDIIAQSYCGKTTSAIKLLDPLQNTYVHSLDGDFKTVYERVTGNKIESDFKNIKISFGNIIEFEENQWFGKVDDTFIKSFFDDPLAKVLVLDITLPATYLTRLKMMLDKPEFQDRTLIITHHKPIKMLNMR